MTKKSSLLLLILQALVEMFVCIVPSPYGSVHTAPVRKRTYRLYVKCAYPVLLIQHIQVHSFQAPRDEWVTRGVGLPRTLPVPRASPKPGRNRCIPPTSALRGPPNICLWTLFFCDSIFDHFFLPRLLMKTCLFWSPSWPPKLIKNQSWNDKNI